MGTIASVYVNQEAQLPVDASDITSLDQAKSELQRLRELLHSVSLVYKGPVLLEKLRGATISIKSASIAFKESPKESKETLFKTFESATSKALAVIRSIQEDVNLRTAIREEKSLQMTLEEKETQNLIYSCIRDVFLQVNEFLESVQANTEYFEAVHPLLYPNSPVVIPPSESSTKPSFGLRATQNDITELYRAEYEVFESMKIENITWNHINNIEPLVEVEFVLSGNELKVATFDELPTCCNHILLANNACEASDFQDHSVECAGTFFTHQGLQDGDLKLKYVIVTTCSQMYPCKTSSIEGALDAFRKLIPEESRTDILALPCLGTFCQRCQPVESSDATEDRQRSILKHLHDWNELHLGLLEKRKTFIGVTTTGDPATLQDA